MTNNRTYETLVLLFCFVKCSAYIKVSLKHPTITFPLMVSPISDKTGVHWTTYAIFIQKFNIRQQPQFSGFCMIIFAQIPCVIYDSSLKAVNVHFKLYDSTSANRDSTRVHKGIWEIALLAFYFE